MSVQALKAFSEGRGLIAFGTLLAAMILALDLSLPLGVAGGVPYVALVCLGWYARNPRNVIALGLVSTILTTIGYFYSPEGVTDSVALANRCLALVAIWGVATFVLVARRAQEGLRESEERCRVLIESSPVCIHEIDLDGKLTSMNAAGLAMMGTDDESKICGLDYLSIPRPESRQAVAQLLADAKQGTSSAFEFTADGPNGESHFSSSFVPIKDSSGRVIRLMGLTQDITEQRNAETDLRDSEERLRAAMNGGLDAIYYMRPVRDDLGDVIDFEFTDVNDKAVGLVKFSREELIGGRLCELMPGSRETGVFDNHKRAFESGVPLEEEVEVTIEGVEASWFLHQIIPIRDGLALHTRDITEIKQARERLLQSQKMEAVGQLTGGIAHDFNNLLAIISGNLELALEDLPADSPLRPRLEAGTKASGRGADLTGRLLAFSRRQTLQPQPTDVNELTAHVLGLATRTLGEAVEIVFEPSEGAWWAHVDPAQLENALLNLAINARDAMPEGGVLTIRTLNACVENEKSDEPATLKAGDYSVIEVADNGGGMSADVLDKVFEPFFTTKDIGQGTGLGLSMVYGFVNQSGGHVEIDSAVGEGTTIRLYLNRAEISDARPAETQSAPPGVVSPTETVLIVEDDPHVRALTVSLVERLGYTVIDTEEAESALKIMANGSQIDLLLSDVVLGKGMNGADLADRVRKEHPGTQVLLMSGFAREAFIPEKDHGITHELIGKPFKLAELGRKIERLLH